LNDICVIGVVYSSAILSNVLPDKGGCQCEFFSLEPLHLVAV